MPKYQATFKRGRRAFLKVFRTKSAKKRAQSALKKRGWFSRKLTRRSKGLF